jgi:hypothetical protein
MLSRQLHFHPQHLRWSAILTLAALLGCDGLTSPSSDTLPVSFSVSTAEAVGGAPALNRASRGAFMATVETPLIIGVGSDTLRIDSVRVVLAQVSLGRAANTACGTEGHNDAADSTCKSLDTGPVIVKLPLTAGALSLFDIPIPKGTYTSFSVRVHKPNRQDSGPNMVAFLAANPTWENISMRVDGTFNGVAVHWSHDPTVQLSHTFTPPLVIDAAGTNFTLKIDVASWFKSATGALIDPNAKTNTLYPQIAANVQKSFKVFRDEQKKGHDDGK